METFFEWLRLSEADITNSAKESPQLENRNWRDTSFKDPRRNLPRIKLYGWLSPGGRFISTERAMNHIDAIEKNPELRALLPAELTDSMALLRDIKKSSQDAVSVGEHPEWHRYEMLSDEIGYKVYNALYSRNYLRVATWGDEVHFEGTSDAIRSLYQKAKDLAEENGFDAKFQKIERVTDAPTKFEMKEPK